MILILFFQSHHNDQSKFGKTSSFSGFRFIYFHQISLTTQQINAKIGWMLHPLQQFNVLCMLLQAINTISLFYSCIADLRLA